MQVGKFSHADTVN